MYIIIGIILVVISLVILVLALWRSKKGNPGDILLDEDTTIQQVFEIIDTAQNFEVLNSILLSQEPVEIRLAKVFDNLFSSEQFQSAEKVAKIMVEFAPDLSSGHSRFGIVSLKMGKFEQAEKSFQNALEIDTDDFRSANNLSYILNQQERYAESVQVLRPIIDNNRGNLASLVNYGIALFHLDKIEKSFETLDSAYRQNPNIPEIHLYIGHCLKAFGDDEKAKLAYGRYKVLKNQLSTKEPTRAKDNDKNSRQVQEQPAKVDKESEIAEEQSEEQQVEKQQSDNVKQTEQTEEIVVPEQNDELEQNIQDNFEEDEK
ncbi:hypothetical protein J7L68_09055 [bacterium]|nr:hypothetical protein [bacterium]